MLIFSRNNDTTSYIPDPTSLIPGSLNFPMLAPVILEGFSVSRQVTDIQNRLSLWRCPGPLERNLSVYSANSQTGRVRVCVYIGVSLNLTCVQIVFEFTSSLSFVPLLFEIFPLLLSQYFSWSVWSIVPFLSLSLYV